MKKTTNFIRIVSFILVITLLSGCGGNTGNGIGSAENQREIRNQDNSAGSNGDSSETAMGRYLGTETDIGDRIDSEIAVMKQVDDGSIIIQDYTGARISSKDKGKTWNDVLMQEEPILQPMKQIGHRNYVLEMELAEDGSAALCYVYGPAADSEEGKADAAADGEENEGDSAVDGEENKGDAAADGEENKGDTAADSEENETDSTAISGGEGKTDTAANDNAENTVEAVDDGSVEDVAESEEDTEELVNFQYLLIDNQGNKIPFEAENALLSMQFAEDGELYLLSEKTIYHLNRETGKTEVYLDCPESVNSFTVGCGLMLLVQEDSIAIYDMETEEWIEDETINNLLSEAGNKVSFMSSDTLTNTVPLLPFMEKEGVMYLAFSQGLFRHAMEGNKMEQVIDGGLSKFSDPSVEIASVLPLEDNEFMVLFSDGIVVHYVYHPDILTVPDKQLRVYSLEWDTYMQQAITIYQGANPNVRVLYETGMNGGAMTREDALKKLNTEIMAGTGPDFIMLDNMPIRSFLEKGVLEDLTPYLNTMDGGSEAGTLAEGLLPAVKNTFEQDGKIMALPTEFTVPMLVGNKELFVNLTDLASLADAAEAYRSKTDEQILRSYTEREVLYFLSMSSAHAWQKEDGSVDESAIKEFLTQAKRIADLDSRTDVSLVAEDMVVLELRTLVTSEINEMLAETSKIAICNVIKGLDLTFISSYMTSYPFRGEIMIELMPGTKEKVFLPVSIVGINAASPNKEIAGGLLQTMISEKVMKYSDSGLPIHKAAYENRFKERFDGGMSYKDGILLIKTPKEEWSANFRRLVESADTPDLTDITVKEVVIEEGVEVLNGTKTVDEAVAAIMNRISIYVAE